MPTISRLPAEWEPQSFVQFTFPHPDSDWAYLYDEVVSCFLKIIELVAHYEPVLVVCHDESEVSKHFKKSTQYPIHFFQLATDDTWARDHGAITVIKDKKPVLLDFIFNGWGNKFSAEKDNLITQKLHESGVLNKQELISFPFVMEGGALESDGKGTLLTTSECMLSVERNPAFSREDIESYLKVNLGLNRVLWLDHGYLAGDDTDSHIDTLARFCDEHTIAYVKCNDPSDEHFDALQKMESQLQSFRQMNGEPYKLVSLPWPDACFDETGQRLPATYANFLIVNGAVLVPTYGDRQDNEALESVKKCFPRHEVVGIDCRVLIEQHGSLHCITMQYPKEVQLTITKND